MSFCTLYPLKYRTSQQPWWFFESNGVDDFSFPSMFPHWWRHNPCWEPFPEFDRMVTWVEKEPETKSQKTAPIIQRKIGDKTIGHASDNKNFAYNFDLTGFDPKDIKVKTMGQKVVVQAETQEKDQKEGCPSVCHRQYHSSVVLPKNVNSEDFKTILNNQGVLSIIAPLQDGRDAYEREVNIQREDRNQEEGCDSKR